MRDRQGCLAGLLELFLLNTLFDWLQRNLIRQRMFVFGNWMRHHFALHLFVLPVPDRHRNELAQSVVSVDLSGG